MMSGASGTDRRKLVGIADQNETAILRDRVDDRRQHVLGQHRGFVDDAGGRLDLRRARVGEIPARVRIEAVAEQQLRDRLRVPEIAGVLAEPDARLAGRGKQPHARAHDLGSAEQ